MPWSGVSARGRETTGTANSWCKKGHFPGSGPDPRGHRRDPAADRSALQRRPVRRRRRGRDGPRPVGSDGGAGPRSRGARAPGAGPSAAVADPFEARLEARPPIFSFTFGTPGVSALTARGLTVLGTATTVEEARRLEAAGVVVAVAQGSEAGGHRGTFEAALFGTVALVPRVVGAVVVPMVAAGGIMDGRVIVAARRWAPAGSRRVRRPWPAARPGSPRPTRRRSGQRRTAGDLDFLPAWVGHPRLTRRTLGRGPLAADPGPHDHSTAGPPAWAVRKPTASAGGITTTGKPGHNPH